MGYTLYRFRVTRSAHTLYLLSLLSTDIAQIMASLILSLSFSYTLELRYSPAATPINYGLPSAYTYEESFQLVGQKRAKAVRVLP
jgi:hypothetical protein|uniref:Uncharacterized protein n=2 Tax=Picea TaxID=3328 RepID=A0A101M5I0_PICGL|nr:hypothetical protein ABT39_MTgene1161 [Picea glauca]QHR91719.1 hypothetical protein Q903MT_gene5755 [Picea sitchensis]